MTPLLRRSSVLALIAICALVLACGRGAKQQPATIDGPAAADTPIHLETRVTTQHYPVRGTTTKAIFDYLAENGPTDEEGERGTGLTSARWTYSWQGKIDREGCSIGSMDISLDITVVLPEHAQLSSLNPDLRRRWLTFADGVAAHEQRHVEIHMEGAETIRSRMASIGVEPTCESLELEVSTAWNEEQAAIDARQEQFHRQEEQRLKSERAPIEAKIQSLRREAESLAAEISAIDRQIDSLHSEVDSLQSSISVLKSQADLILKAYPGGMPPAVYAQYQSLAQQYSSLVQRHNAQVDAYNQLVTRRPELDQRLQTLQAQIADLIETYNWTR